VIAGAFLGQREQHISIFNYTAKPQKLIESLNLTHKLNTGPEMSIKNRQQKTALRIAREGW